MGIKCKHALSPDPHAPHPPPSWPLQASCRNSALSLWEWRQKPFWPWHLTGCCRLYPPWPNTHHASAPHRPVPSPPNYGYITHTQGHTHTSLDEKVHSVLHWYCQQVCHLTLFWPGLSRSGQLVGWCGAFAWLHASAQCPVQNPSAREQRCCCVHQTLEHTAGISLSSLMS